MLIDDLRKGLPPEDQHLEYKSAVMPPRDLAPEIAAFANADGGHIVFGIWENSTVIGIDPRAPAADAVQVALKYLRTRPRVYHYDEQLEDKRIYIVEIERSPVPIVANDNVTYTRQGNRIRRDPPLQQTPWIPTDNPQLNALYQRLQETLKDAV